MIVTVDFDEKTITVPEESIDNLATIANKYFSVEQWSDFQIVIKYDDGEES